jgi:transcriptional regulator with XRE-family HTH domain
MSDLVCVRSYMGRPSKKAPKDIPPWAHRLKRARENAGLTQRELSERVSIAATSLSNWETGVHQPDLAQFQAVANATGADVVWIVFGVGRGDPSGNPSRTDPLPSVAIDAEKVNRHLVWTIYETARFMYEEGIEANGAQIISYAHHILAAAKDCLDDVSAKEAISRKLESEREGLRADLEKVRKKRFNFGNPKIDD